MESINHSPLRYSLLLCAPAAGKPTCSFHSLSTQIRHVSCKEKNKVEAVNLWSCFVSEASGESAEEKSFRLPRILSGVLGCPACARVSSTTALSLLSLLLTALTCPYRADGAIAAIALQHSWLWRWSSQTSNTEVIPFLMPLVMQQRVFIFTYKYKMVRYHIFEQNL